VLGSLFVIAQQASAQHGNRAPLLLAFDPEVRALVAQPLLLAVGAVLIAGQVPESDIATDAWVASLATTLALATAWTLATAGFRLYALLLKATAPGNYALQALDGVEANLLRGRTDQVVIASGCSARCSVARFSAETRLRYQQR
jgi:hypothetical protein